MRRKRKVKQNQQGETFTKPKDKLHEKVDKTLEKGRTIKSDQARRILSNIQFINKAIEKPVKNTKFDKKVFGFEVINFNSYLNQVMWPRSIYVTDKLTRLGMSARLEFLKRYLAKKRKVSMNFIFILLILFGIVVVLIIIVFLLPKLGAVI